MFTRRILHLQLPITLPSTLLRYEIPRTFRLAGDGTKSRDRGWSNHSGLTLLEVILTLSLAVVIVGMIGGAMRTYGLQMGVRDLEIRRTELAAQLMGMIQQDLMAAVRSQEIDNAPLEQFLLSSMGQTSVDEDLQSDLSVAGLESGSTADGLAADESASGELAAGETDSLLIANSAVLQDPGLIGNSSVLQIDASRLPRVEEYSLGGLGGAVLQDVPSDLKTIRYFVQPAGSSGGVQDRFAEITSAGNGGLVRRSVDRAITNQVIDNGSLAQLDASGQMLAPEVIQVEFLYFDGTQWISQWNSDDVGRLPLAVDVTLTLRSIGDAEQEDQVQYRQLIRLPQGELEEPDTTESSLGGDAEGVSDDGF